MRFGPNTLGIPPSRALSAGRLTNLGAHVTLSTGASPRLLVGPQTIMFALVPPLFFLPLMIGPLGMQEMLIILVVALIVFGPRKLPQIGKTLGKSIAEFRRTSTELRSTLEREVQMEEFRTARSEVSGLGKEVADLGRGLDPDAGSGPSAAKPPAAAKPPQSDGGGAGDSGEPSATRERETQNGTGDSSASGPETGVAEGPEGVAEGASEAGSAERESADGSGK